MEVREGKVELYAEWAFQKAEMDESVIGAFKNAPRMQASTIGNSLGNLEETFRKIETRFSEKDKGAFSADIQESKTFVNSRAEIEGILKGLQTGDKKTFTKDGIRQPKRFEPSESLEFLKRGGVLQVSVSYLVEIGDSKLIVNHNGLLAKENGTFYFQEERRSLELIASFGWVAPAFVYSFGKSES